MSFKLLPNDLIIIIFDFLLNLSSMNQNMFRYFCKDGHHQNLLIQVSTLQSLNQQLYWDEEYFQEFWFSLWLRNCFIRSDSITDYRLASLRKQLKEEQVMRRMSMRRSVLLFLLARKKGRKEKEATTTEVKILVSGMSRYSLEIQLLNWKVGSGKSSIIGKYICGNSSQLLWVNDPTIEDSYRKLTRINNELILFDIFELERLDEMSEMSKQYCEKSNGVMQGGPMLMSACYLKIK